MRFKMFSILCCLHISMLCAAPEPVVPVAQSLKQRQPHWRPKVSDSYGEGQPQRVLFYEQITELGELPVKQVIFHPNGQIHNETDLITISEEEPGYADWKSTIVPHGVNVTFFSNGQIEKLSFYNRGLLHGETKVFFEDGKLHAQCGFKQGQRHGQMISYFQNGTKSEEMTYEEGKIIGEAVRYFEKGNRAALIPYENGVPHGNALEWYPEGILKASLRYQNGVLHSDGKNPALVVYGLDRSIQEVQDYHQGQPIGTHFKYHPNGKESYKVQYKNGKKQGKEQIFSEEGKVLGEGEFREGVPLGKHWLNAPNGQQIYRASFDLQGNLL